MKEFALGCLLGLAAALPVSAQTKAAVNPLGHGQEFGGIRTFLHAPYIGDIEKTDADIVVVGVPFDEGTSARPGARFGPRDIREASLIYAWSRRNGFFYIDDERWVLQGIRWVDVGDVDVEPMDPHVTFGRVTEAVRAIRRRNALPVVLGGDHSITFPVVRAYELPSLTVIHFDAHVDSYGEPPSRDAISTAVTDHGAWVSAVAQLPGIKIVQIGMRGVANDEHGLKLSRKYGATLVTSERVQRNGIEPALAAIPKSENIYVSIDIDVLDPALAPGTGTVEVGGLTFQQLSDILRAIPSKGRLVGMDVVEMNSYYDPTGVTAQTAARLIIDLLGAALPGKAAGAH
jgi:agmatinase